MSEPLNTHFWKMKDGNFRGQPITRVPASHLKWMVSTNHKHADYARAEMDRRGTITPDLEISGHAIDRASLHCLKIWRRDRKPDEGLHSWLVRVAREAWDLKVPDAAPERRNHKGIRFVFRFESAWPVLLTVVKLKVPTKKTPPRRTAA
jgi:hypothetical protein